MANKKYPFTRTLVTQTVTALVFDKESAEAMNKTIVLTSPINDPAKLEKAVAKEIDSETIKFIEIVDVVTDEQLYGITSADFMAHAVKLDPKTRKELI